MSDQTIYHDTESGVYKSDAFQSDEGKSRHYEAIIEDSPDGGYHLRVELYEGGASAPIQSWKTDEVQSVDEAVRGLGEFAKNWKIHKAYVEDNIFEPDEIVVKSPTQRSTLTSSDKQNPPGTENSDKKPSSPPPTPEKRLQTQPKDTQPIPDAAPDNRTTTTKPSENHRTQRSSSASDIADAFDRQRDEAKRGIAAWRGQLDEMVQDSGSIWAVLGATAAATALSVTELAMDQASGLLGVTRLGQGVAKGSFSGVMEDVDRLASVLPQSRVVKALGMSADVYAVGKAATTGGDPLSIAANVAGAVIGAKSKKRGSQAGGQGGKLPKAKGVRHLPRNYKPPEYGRSRFPRTRNQIGIPQQRRSGKVRKLPSGRTGRGEHWAEHGREFPKYSNVRQYERNAIKFCRSSKTIKFYYSHYGRPTIGYVNYKTGKFAATSVDGKVIYTFFSPDNIKQYVSNILTR